ncbi:MAG: hypothetical protein M3Z35_13825, partial [Nitrospirota bacterium]|nr:hypothetical protein [Nitrospirota bacterium]
SRPGGVSETLRIANRVLAFSVHLPCRTITPAIVRSVHQDGYKLFAYTADRVSTWERLIECGVDAIFTNLPDRLHSFLHRCGIASNDHIRPKGQLNYS